MSGVVGWRGLSCDSMHEGARCVLVVGHSGWHTDGSYTEWLADEERVESVVCNSRVFDTCADDGSDTLVYCELPEDHRGGHRGEGLIWVGECPIPSPASRRF